MLRFQTNGNLFQVKNKVDEMNKLPGRHLEQFYQRYLIRQNFCPKNIQDHRKVKALKAKGTSQHFILPHSFGEALPFINVSLFKRQNTFLVFDDKTLFQQTT